MKTTKVTIQCIGPSCERTQSLRKSRLIACDYYACGRCSQTIVHPSVEGCVLVVTHAAAGGFAGYTIKPMDPADEADLARARAVRDAAFGPVAIKALTKLEA